jgi:hypothetical protein
MPACSAAGLSRRPRDDVAVWWQALLDNRRSPAEIHEWVRPWVEETGDAIDDPITAMGVQHLYGFEGRPGPEAHALFERWLAHGERFDADPEGWQRERLTQSVLAIRRDQGLERARALALQLAARGSLSDADVSRILGVPTT